MLTSRAFLISVIVGLVSAFAAPAIAHSDRPMAVVATFSILGDMVKRVGGEHIAVTTLVGPDGDTHVYQPTPADARAVNEAKILVVNGLQFEGWLDRLIEVSDFDGIRVLATEGIEPIAYDDHEHETMRQRRMTMITRRMLTQKRMTITITSTRRMLRQRRMTMITRRMLTQKRMTITITSTRRMLRQATTTITMARLTRTPGIASAMPWSMSTTLLPLWPRPIR